MEWREYPVKNISRLCSRSSSVSFEIASGLTPTVPSVAEVEAGDAAERRDVLILFSDGPLEHVDFDVAGLFGQSLRASPAGA